MDIQALTNQIYLGIKEEAQVLLAEGRAIQEITTLDDDPLIKLIPRRPEAASLEISVDSEHSVTCFPGKSGMTYEVFSRHPNEIRDDVCSLVKAVIEGGYSEIVNDAGKKTKIVAEWMEGTTERSPRYNVLRRPRPDAKGWRTVTYKPY